MIHVIATIETRPGQRENLLTELRQILPPVRAEKGCLEYGPAIDVDSGISVQAPMRDNVVLVIEKWESLEALKAHLMTPHLIEYRTKIKDFVARVHLQVLQPA